MNFTRAIVRAPGANFADGLTEANLGRPDYGLALKQFEAYCAALESCGLKLTRLPADERFPDSCFVEDTAVLTPRGAVVTRPGAASRAGETVSVSAALAEFFPEFQTIEPPGTLDGGDLCEAGERFFIGLSRRTNAEGARQLAAILAGWGYASTVVDIRATAGILHLKSGVTCLGEDRLAVIPALAGRAAFKGYKLAQLQPREEYAANCLRVNDTLLHAAGFPAFAAELQRWGYQTVALEMSEFRKMDGGLSCLSLRF
jgi:dimethylargininase